MIHFACKQCAKPFSRPEEAAGMMVFCVCGAGNRVPWESTIADPGPDAEQEHASAEPGADRGEPPPMRRRSRSGERQVPERDGACCFNHQDRPKHSLCAECDESFCESCLIDVQGRTLCGPCKNFHLRVLQRGPRFSVAALFSLLLGLFTGPTGLCCVSLSASVRSGAPSLVGMLLPLVAILLGGWALRDIETNPRVCGRSIAIAGMVSGLVTAFLTAVFAVLIERQME